jgi:hypothetical protein
MMMPVVRSRPPTPGYLGSQETFYVGTFKGVGRIYRQTSVDIYTTVAQCKLYTTKTPIRAVDLLKHRVLQFYEANDLPVLRILTDRGTVVAQCPALSTVLFHQRH